MRALTDLATRRPRCYVVEAPGGAAVRAAVEAELDRRGWQAAGSAASADALLVAGTLPGDLEPAAELLWSQLPGPRARVSVTRADDVTGAFDGVQAQLRDADRQREDAAQRPEDAVSPWLPEAGEDHGDHEGEHHDHGGHDHGGHDHGGMAPGGIPLAEGADDRDGLEMDVLVHPLGPLLDRWPGGLEVRATLHGDVVGDLEVRWWDPVSTASRTEQLAPAAAAYDAAATTLALAGDDHGARLARRLRDDPAPSADTAAARLARRVGRWRRWSFLPADAANALSHLLAHAGNGDGTPEPLDDAGLGELLRGRDLGDARLLVAAHGPRLRAAVEAGVRDA